MAGALIVTCSQCATKFKIADDKLTPRGVKVRCSKCKHTFTVMPDGHTVSADGVAAPAGVAPAAPPQSRPPAIPPPPVMPGATKPGSPPPPKPHAATGAKATGSDVVSSNLPEVIRDELPDELPEDIFSATTKVGPPPPGFSGPSMASSGPLPPPPVPVPELAPPVAGPGALPKDMLDSIDLDSDAPIPEAATVKAPPPPPAPPAGTSFPRPAPPPPKPLVAPASEPKAAAASAPALDPFADLDLGGPAAPPRPLVPPRPLSPVGPPPPPKPAPPRPAPPKPAPAVAPNASDPFADLAMVNPPAAPAGGAPRPPPAAAPSAGDPFADLDLGPAPAAAVKPAPAPSAGGAFADLDAGLGAPAVAPAGAPARPGPAARRPLDDPFAGALPEGAAGQTAKISAADIHERDLAELGLGEGGDSLEIDREDRPEPAAPAGGERRPPPPKGMGVQVGDGATRDSMGNIDFGEVPAAPASGDPFAGVELEARGADAGRSSKPAAAGGELFGELGDPFAGIQGKAAGGPPPLPAASGQDLFPDAGGPPGGPPPAAAGGDPFAALAGAEGGAPGEADPFASLSLGGGGAAEPDQGAGLGIDAEGRLVGKAAPPPPAPMKMVAPAATPKEAPAAPVGLERPVLPAPVAPLSEPPQAPTSLAYKIGFGLLLVIIVLFVFIVFRAGGKPDLTHWSTYVEAFTGQVGDEAAVGDLLTREVRSTAYPGKDGLPLVLLWGQVENSSAEPRRGLAVTGQLLDGDRQVRRELTVPAGVVFEPHEVHALSDLQSVADAYRARARPDHELLPKQSVAFMVVMPGAPEDLESLSIQVLARSVPDPLAGLPAPLPPPEVEPPDEPAPPAPKKPAPPRPAAR